MANPAASSASPMARQRPGNVATERKPSVMARRMKGDRGSR